MRTRFVTPVVIISILLALLAGEGCSLFGAGRGNSAATTMKQMPLGAHTYGYWAINTLRGEDEALYPIYDKFIPSAAVAQIQEMGIMRMSINFAAKTIDDSGNALVMLGINYNADSIEFKLANLGWTQSDYADAAMWSPPEGSNLKTMALKKGIIIMGDEAAVKKGVDSVGGSGTPNLYEDQTLRPVMDSLPSGFITFVYQGGPFPDNRANGRSFAKSGADAVKITVVYSFEDNPAANKYLEAVADLLSGAGYRDVKAQRKSNLIVATGLIAITDFTTSLAW